MLYALIVAAALFFAVEFRFLIREWWSDFKLRRELDRPRSHLREGWTSKGIERFRGRLGDARDSMKRPRRAKDEAA